MTMLAPRERELLTAAADGELTAAESSAVKRLLRQSEEARALFAQLKRDVQQLRSLPRVAPPHDIAYGVLRVITERALTPTPLPPERRRNFFALNNPAAWSGMAAAAAILLTVSVGSYLYFAASETYLARSNSKENSRLRPSVTDEDVRILPSGSGVAASRSRPAKNEQGPGDVESGIAKLDPPALEAGPLPREVKDPYASQPKDPSPTFEVVDNLRIPLILPLRDLDQAYPKQKLRDEMAKDEFIHVDLFCDDSVRGVEFLQAALKGRGHQLLIDPQAQDRLKKKQRSEFVLYTESMTTEEVAQLLEALGADDRKAEAKKSGDGPFDKFVLAPFSSADLNRLARLLGVPAAQLKQPSKKATIDPRRPISEGTALAISQNLGKGPTPAAKLTDKLSLLLASGPASSQQSKEVKQFFDKRGDRKIGTTPLMLVLKAL